MKNTDHPTADHQSMKDEYDRRYGGNYMDADAYSNWVHDGLAAYRVRQTLQQIPGSPRRILDYGCGQGKWTPLLREVFYGAEIVGIDRFVSLLKNGREQSPTGEQIFFFEKEEGHLRRMESAQTIALFRKEGLELRHEFYSGQFFAALDWLVRGTGPHYINGMFRGVIPVSSLASIKLFLMRKLLIGLHRFLRYRNLDLTKRRAFLKQSIVRLVSRIASNLDDRIMKLARREWNIHREDKAGSVQYLIFEKVA